MNRMLNMKRMTVALGALVLGWSLTLGAADSWTNVSMVDTLCSAKVKANPDAHTRACALQCAKGGYGILASDGTYLKFDKAGNDQALAILKASKATDHLRVTVTGTRKGDTIAVGSIQPGQ
jgi:hypothetical protein